MSILSELTLDHLMYLVAFAQTGTVTGGAKKLGVSQPQFSKKMDFWRDKRPTLFRRVGRRDVLTPRGEQVVAAARCVLRQTDDIQKFLRESVDEPQILSASAGATSSGLFLAPAVAEMRRTNSPWILKTTMLRGSDRIRAVSTGEIDVAIASHSTPQIQVTAGREQELEVEEIAVRPLCAAAHSETPAGKELSRFLRGQEVPVDTLSHWDLIGLDPRSGVRRQLEAVASTVGCQLHFTAHAGGWWAIKEFMKAGIGVAILPLDMINQEDVGLCTIRRIAPANSIHEHVITRRGDSREIMSKLREMLVGCGAKHMESERRRWDGVL